MAHHPHTPRNIKTTNLAQIIQTNFIITTTSSTQTSLQKHIYTQITQDNIKFLVQPSNIYPSESSLPHNHLAPLSYQKRLDESIVVPVENATHHPTQ